MLQIGKKLFIQTITMYYVGEVVAYGDKWVTLTAAAWVADTGPFAAAMASGKFQEVEAFPPTMEISVQLDAVVMMCPYVGALPLVEN